MNQTISDLDKLNSGYVLKKTGKRREKIVSIRRLKGCDICSLTIESNYKCVETTINNKTLFTSCLECYLRDQE